MATQKQKEKALERAAKAQTRYWDALHALEDALGFDIDASELGELGAYTVEDLEQEQDEEDAVNHSADPDEDDESEPEPVDAGILHTVGLTEVSPGKYWPIPEPVETKAAERIKELEAVFEAEEISEANGAEPQLDENGKVVEDIATCGTCGQSWNDALITGRTPAPSARCPYEYIHPQLAELKRLRVKLANRRIIEGGA